MKVLTIIGTRPEIIRTSRILPKLDRFSKHIIVHTNQNFTQNTKDIFFEQLSLRQPDYTLYTRMNDGNTHSVFGLGGQLADMFPEIENILYKEKPDKVFILGDTNSALCSIIAERIGIPVFHAESANRNFNHEVPEEINRKLIDSISTYNLFYTDTNRHTLLREGANPKRIFQMGNPTKEVLTYYGEKIDKSNILEKLGLKSKQYFLVDIHRSENVNNINRFEEILEGLNLISDKYQIPIICSMHPKAKDKLKDCKVRLRNNILILDAFGYFDFVKLENNTRVGLTDSGLCSEEYCVMHIPCVIVRNETERPEVVEAGGAIISGINADRIIASVDLMDRLENCKWTLPNGYDYMNVSDRAVNYILSKNQ